MSPASRGRTPKKNKRSARPSAVAGPVGSCDCPGCSGEIVSLSDLVDGVLANVPDLTETDDPLEAEVGAAVLVAMCELSGEEFEDAIADGFVPEFESRGESRALTLLLALGSVCGGRAGKAATTAAHRLIAAGVTPPAWAAEVEQVPAAGDCWRLADPEGTGSTLIGTFHRAGRSHAFLVTVDHTDCGAASNSMLLDAADLPTALNVLEQAELAVDKECVDPAELRWQVECALDARAVHDGDLLDVPFDDDDLPDYYPLAVLFRARLRALPDSGKPKPGHPSGPGPLLGLFGTPVPPALPRSGPAGIYQLKIGLRDAKPPIWRRLEVSADVDLAQLHGIIQVAFGWDDGHLHVFQTPYGDFGMPDADLGHRPNIPSPSVRSCPTPATSSPMSTTSATTGTTG